MFKPLYCPRKNCSCRFSPPKKEAWYRSFGSYSTRLFGQVPRFQCLFCKRTFSQQTFSLNYYVKKNINYSFIYQKINAGAGIRSISRKLKIGPNSIRNRIDRMARNAIIFHEQILKGLPFHEDFTAHGFQNFSVSRFSPDNCPVLAGKKSRFIYQIDYLPLRQRGRMPSKQKDPRRRNAPVRRPPAAAAERSFLNLCEGLACLTKDRKNKLILYTEEKKVYQRALEKSPVCSQRLKEGRWVHKTVSSKALRAHPLFPVNPKETAPPAWEGIRFHKNVNDAVFRMNLCQFEHNYTNPRQLQRPGDSGSPAAEAGAGIPPMVKMKKTFFQKRYHWREKSELSPFSLKTLARRWQTPMGKKAPRERKHLGE